MVVPEVEDEELFRSLIAKCEPNYFARQTPYVPFNVQAMREIGYYGYDTAPFEGLLSRPAYEGYMRRVMIPEELNYLEFRGDLYEQCCRFLREKDIPAMFIYDLSGDCKPQTAAALVALYKRHCQILRINIRCGIIHNAQMLFVCCHNNASVVPRVLDCIGKQIFHGICQQISVLLMMSSAYDTFFMIECRYSNSCSSTY